MNVASRLARIERCIPNRCPPGEDPVLWLTGHDAECIDMVARMHFLKTRPPAGLDVEAVRAALYRRWKDRRDELLAGAPASEDWAERQRLRIEGYPAPGSDIPWAR